LCVQQRFFNVKETSILSVRQRLEKTLNSTLPNENDVYKTIRVLEELQQDPSSSLPTDSLLCAVLRTISTVYEAPFQSKSGHPVYLFQTTDLAKDKGKGWAFINFQEGSLGSLLMEIIGVNLGDLKTATGTDAPYHIMM
jgi:hypothetical protein